MYSSGRSGRYSGFQSRPRRRIFPDDEEIDFDWKRPTCDKLGEILQNIVIRNVTIISQNHRLNYLKFFTKLCQELGESISNEDEVTFTLDEILCCLRVVFFHDSAEVRAAGIRAIRYLLRSEKALDAFYRLNMAQLVARSIDVSLNNRVERVQALRIAQKILCINPSRFPDHLTNCLIALVRDGQSGERDDRDLTRSAYAILTELLVLNPEKSVKAGVVGALIDSVVSSTNIYGNMNEATILSMINLLNCPTTRSLMSSKDCHLDYFLAPFLDPHFALPNQSLNKQGQGIMSLSDETRDLEARYQSHKNALLSILRSWSGLVFLCETLDYVSVQNISQETNSESRGMNESATAAGLEAMRSPGSAFSSPPDSSNAINNFIDRFSADNFPSMDARKKPINGIQSLIEMLYLTDSSVRKIIMEVIFEAFYIPLPKWSEDFTDALQSVTTSFYQESWTLLFGFVESEARSVLPPLARHRLNLMDNYLALLLLAFFNHGLVEALVCVIIGSDKFNSVRATILLGELLHLSSRLLPAEMIHNHHLLPKLLALAGEEVASVNDHQKTSESFLAKCAIANLQLINTLKCSSSLVLYNFSSRGGSQTFATTPSNASKLHPKLSNCSQPSNQSSGILTTSSTLCSSSSFAHSLYLERLIYYANQQKLSVSHHHHHVNPLESPLSSMAMEENGIFNTCLSTDEEFCKHAISKVFPVNHRIRHVKSFGFKFKVEEPIQATIQENGLDSNAKKRPFSDHEDWDWDLIINVLERAGSSKTTNEKGTKKMKLLSNKEFDGFLRRVIQFYKPTSKQFSSIDKSYGRYRPLCAAGIALLDFLSKADDIKCAKLMEELLTDIQLSIAQVTTERRNDPLASAIFGPSHLSNTLSQYYFLFIGHLSSSYKGRKMLANAKLWEQLIKLVSGPRSEIYVKLIISSLDYSKECDHFNARKILAKVLTSDCELAKLYATKFMRVLLRLGIPEFEKWGIELLVQKMCDDNEAVSLAATEILDEACDDPRYLEALIGLRPPLLHIGDRGQLILVRYLSLPSGYAFLRDSNYLNCEIERWTNSYCLRYVMIVEDQMQECLSLHQRNEDGTYGRRSDRKSTELKQAFIAPHLLGEMAKHKESFDLIVNRGLLKQHCLTIMNLGHQLHSARDDDILKLKAALWAVGHVGASAPGIKLLCDEEILGYIVSLAGSSPVLTVRGTAFFVLGLIASTKEGSALLEEFGWEAIKHDNISRWTIDDSVLEDVQSQLITTLPHRRKHTFSESSTGTRMTDWFCMMTNRKRTDTPPVAVTPTSEAPDGHSNETNEPYHPLNNHDQLNPASSSLSPVHKLPCPPSSRYRSISDCQANSTIDEEGKPPASRNGTLLIENDEHIDDASDSGSGIWMKARSRGESTCDSNRKDTTGSETSTGGKTERRDSGLVVDSPHRPLPNRKPYTVRKVSEPVYPRDRTISEKNGDHNGPFKIRSGSCCNTSNFNELTVTSTTSGCSLPTVDTIFGHRGDIRRLHHTLVHHARPATLVSHNFSSLPRQKSSSVLSSPSSGPIDNPSYDLVPSALDAHGYATIMRHRRNRISSVLNFKHSISIDYDDRSERKFLDPIAFSSKTPSRSSTVISLSKIGSLDDVASETSSLAEEYVKESFEGRLYMGLALPVDLSLIFTLPSDVSNRDRKGSLYLQNPRQIRGKHHNRSNCNPEWKTHLDKQMTSSLTLKDGLELHLESTCFQCSSALLNMGRTLRDEEQTDSLILAPGKNSCSVISPSAGNVTELGIDSRSCLLEVSSPHEGGASKSSYTTDESTTPIFHETSDVPPAQNASGHPQNKAIDSALVRKEALRLILSLSGSVAAKSAEQGLLNLKTKFPQAFQDVCLYSEVCLQLASCGFRLSARRFLQELFLDLPYDCFYQEAERVLECHGLKRLV